MRNRIIYARLLPLVWVGALLLAGCTGVVAPVAPSAHDASGASTARQVVDISSFTNLDPSGACWGEYFVLGNVYETLTRYNPPGVEPFVAPNLATDWTVTDDGHTWTFHLQEGVKFHDGSDLDAAAVKFSLERHKEMGCSSYLYAPIETIETPDAHTVVIHLTDPVPMDLILASGYSAWIMSPTSAVSKGPDWFAEGNDAGSGPYKMESYAPGERLIVTRFDDYWRGWSPDQIETVVFEQVEDPMAVEQMLRAGQVDLANSRALSPEQMASLDKDEKLVLDASPGSLVAVLYLNERRAPTDDPLVRQALAYSFPYDEVIANTNLGKGSRSHGAVPASIWGHNPGQPRYPYDPEKAKALLEQAGYGDGLELEFSFDTSEQPVAEMWRAALAKIGVNLTLIPIDWNTRMEKVKNDPGNAPQINSTFWGPDAVGPYTYLYGMFHTEGPSTFNAGFYSNSAFDKMIDDANRLSATDREAAAQMFVAAQKFLDDDAAGIFVQDFPNLTILASDLQGHIGNPGYNNAVFWYDLRR